MIGYDIGGIGGVGFAWDSFKFNENTHHLYDIINRSKVMNIIEHN